MSRPQKHPVTGIYQLRKRVPRELIPLVGKAVIKISLKTRDPQEAKVVHARILADVESQWRQLSAGEISLTQKQAVAMAGEIYRNMIASNEDNPGHPGKWQRAAMWDYLHLRPDKVKVTRVLKDDARIDAFIEHQRVHRHDKEITEYLARHGYRLDDESMSRLRQAVGQATMQAKEHLIRLAEGDYRPDPDATRFPKLELAPKRSDGQDLGSYALITVFEDYAKEKQIAAATYKKWRPIIVKVASEVPDARNLTRQWVIDWKDRLLKQGLANSSVKNSYLASLKTVCTWGVANARLEANPVDGVTVSIPKKSKTREKSFTNAEVLTILRGTLEATPTKMSASMKHARRWVPWLCAYTGARVGEISQLRKQDIQLDDGHWLIWIDPLAGSTKDGNARFVGIHPHLIEQGFLDFVKSRKSDGPLFFDPARYRGGKDGSPQYKKVGERLGKWVREMGVDDGRIMPNHGWRHLFKTNARGVDMDSGTRDYMQGHVASTEGEKYGGHLPHVLTREVSKLKRFDLEGTSEPGST